MQALGLQQQEATGEKSRTFLIVRAIPSKHLTRRCSTRDRNRAPWLLQGSIIFGVASVLNFGAFGFAPASILAPLE